MTSQSFDDEAVLAVHRGGKLRISPTIDVHGPEELSLAYTPGVAQVCRTIAERPTLAHDYTWKRNTVAVVTDGSAVLGLGNIGPTAALPVMEGKALLFRNFADVDAVPICLSCTDVDELVETVARLSPGFGGINLEDIAAPRCFEVERRLIERCDIPVFHDDQHGTAIVVLAALTGALELTGRKMVDTRIVISGAGAAGVAVATILRASGAYDVVVCDRAGTLHPAREDLADAEAPGANPAKVALATETNPERHTGTLAEVLAGADVFIGVSGGTVDEATVATMAADAIVFGLANPNPEVPPEVAERHAAVVATGRSDYPNQINNVLAFPGVFRGALDARAARITEPMKLAAARALADLAAENLRPDRVVPSPFDPRVGPAVAAAVADAAGG